MLALAPCLFYLASAEDMPILRGQINTLGSRGNQYTWSPIEYPIYYITSTIKVDVHNVIYIYLYVILYIEQSILCSKCFLPDVKYFICYVPLADYFRTNQPFEKDAVIWDIHALVFVFCNILLPIGTYGPGNHCRSLINKLDWHVDYDHILVLIAFLISVFTLQFSKFTGTPLNRPCGRSPIPPGPNGSGSPRSLRPRWLQALAAWASPGLMAQALTGHTL